MTFRWLSLSLVMCLSAAMAQTESPGRIVFSRNMINPVNPGPGVFGFQAGDVIYGVALFDEPLSKLTKTEGQRELKLKVVISKWKAPGPGGGKGMEVQLTTSTLRVSGAAATQAYLPVDIVPAPGAMTAYGKPDLNYDRTKDQFQGPIQFARALARLNARDHTLLVRVVHGENEVLAEGRFVIRRGDFSNYENRAQALEQVALGRHTQLGAMPRPQCMDEALASDLTKAFTSSQAFRTRVRGRVLKLVIIDKRWSVRRHNVTAAILDRSIRAAIAVKNTNEECTVWKPVTFHQVYSNGQYGQTQVKDLGQPCVISCDEVF